jgi:4-amino-4-deoxy-L-arabinose transferase-like glycosyltransferase
MVWSGRWYLLSIPDLIDSTEGRYASISKHMYAHGELITPIITRHGVSQPYLGKPPLYFWMGDLAYSFLGVTNTAARAPSFVSAVGTLLVTYAGVYYMAGGLVALGTLVILSTTAIFFFLSGGVMLDMTVTFCVISACFGFFHAKRWIMWGYLFFLALALGMLTKGPVAIVLVGVVVIPWLLVQWMIHRKIPEQVEALPWKSGIVLTVLLTAPWYLAQEQKNDGFLYYFFVQENFLRYVSSEYGDRYGTGHKEPRGMSWLMFIALASPWSLLLLGSLLWKIRKGSFSEGWNNLKDDPALLYLLLMMTTCPAFFTFARQLTGTYILPALPGFAAFTSWLFLSQKEYTTRIQATAYKLLSMIPILAVGATFLLSCTSIFFENAWSTWCITTFFSATLFFLLWRKFKVTSAGSNEFYNSFLLSGASIFFAFAFVILNLSNYQSLYRSTGRLFTSIRSLASSERVVKVGFPFSFPFSTKFYGEIGELPLATSVRVTPNDALSKDLQFVVVNQERVKEFESLHGKITSLLTVGDWVIYPGKEFRNQVTQ